jgi:hypothetical protein
MKKGILIVLFTGIKAIFISQTIPCSNFTITGSYPDSINSNDYQFSINFNANSNEIVGYPYISALLDCTGDTVATGGLFYFGQLGQTTLDYPVTLVDMTSWCEPLTAIFIYGSGPLNEADTCLLVFQSAIISDDLEMNNISIYPNPAAQQLSIKGLSPNLNGKIIISNLIGQVVLEKENQSTINVESLVYGAYILTISDGFSLLSRRFLKGN